jgi:uncharacterized membrane protein YidH (DUF202 family)
MPVIAKHIAALERTYLAYLRTSLALSFIGVSIAQLIRLNNDNNTAGALSAAFISGSIVVVLAGAIRFWRQQTAMAKGRVFAGGWEMMAIYGLMIAVRRMPLCDKLMRSNSFLSSQLVIATLVVNLFQL